MAQKCVHKGCDKTFVDPDEPCVYHPGPPVFHEGQKGMGNLIDVGDILAYMNRLGLL
jgi:hypothetical protein